MTDGDADPGDEPAEGSDAAAGGVTGDASDGAAEETPADDAEETPIADAEDATAGDGTADRDALVFAVASGKGGVGKTTSVVNLAASMADAGRDVVVVDFDLGMANVSDFLDFEKPPRNLHDVLAGDANPGEAVAEVPGGFSVLPGGTELEDFGKADPANLRDVIGTLCEHFDVVLIDTGAGLSHDTAVPLGVADQVLLVTTAQTASLANTRKTRELAERLGGDVEGIIITRVGGGAAESTETIQGEFDVPILGSIPEDRATAEAAKAGTPLLVHSPDSPASQAYRELAYDLLGESLPLDFRDGASEEPDTAEPAGGGMSGLVEEAESGATESEDAGPQKRSLLSKLTGGLVGGKK